MILLDGRQGEGGGQVLRTALALSALTGSPFTLDQVRAGRRKPGLLRQHLTAVRAAVEVCGGEVEGAELGSQRVVFHPGAIRPGAYSFAIGSAGSTSLVLQTVLPMLMGAASESTVQVDGGTHNPASPSADFLRTTFAAGLRHFGPELKLRLRRHGFFPAGGGRVEALVQPAALVPARLEERGELRGIRVRGLASGGPVTTLHQAVGSLKYSLGLDRADVSVEEVRSAGPGQVLMVEVDLDPVPQVFTVCGDRNTAWSELASRLLAEVQRWLESGAPIDEHLADQLLLPMALAGGGSLRTTTPSLHTTTNVAVIERFLPVRFGVEGLGEGVVRVVVGGQAT
jgi:RNA 3'-terminal phosphate cyclase (ATP)